MIPAQTLFETSKCYLCYGVSQAEAMELALLDNIAASSGSSGGGASWGAITGTLSNQLDLQAALDAKIDHYVVTLFNSAFAPTMLNSTTYFLGQFGDGLAGNQTTYNNVRTMIPITGTIVAVTLMVNPEVANSSAELMTVSLNKNNGTMQALAPGTNLAGPKSLLWSGLNFAVTAGDFIAMQFVTPVWTTPPNTVRMCANLIIKKT